jgi:hypothetical protein
VDIQEFIEFPVIRSHQSSTSTLSLRNPSKSAINWSLLVNEDMQDIFSPLIPSVPILPYLLTQKGHITSKGTAEITLTFTPHTINSYESACTVTTEFGVSVVTLFGVCEALDVMFEREVDFGVVDTARPVFKVVQVTNKGVVPVKLELRHGEDNIAVEPMYRPLKRGLIVGVLSLLVKKQRKSG